MKAYFISGLAADRRVFRNIQLPAHFEAVYLDWLPPGKHESLPFYAMRLAEKIDTSEPFILIGLSFGGMLATEIARRYEPAATILLASIPVAKQLPRYYRVGGMLRLHKIIPASVVKTSVITKRFFTAESEEDKKMIKEIARECDMKFIRWGLDAILKWKNTQMPQPIWHIHGDKDGILPVRYTKPTHTITGGGHLLVTSNAKQVNEALREVLLPVLNNKQAI